MVRPLVVFLFALLFACTATPTSAPTPSTPFPTIAATPVAASARPTRTASPPPIKPPIDTPAWFRDVVLYEIFPRSFYDSNGDGTGDLDGITARLEYIEQLGVGALWLTPVFDSPSYHGYDTLDYYKIHPDFGTETDLIELVAEAHRRDIRVLLDFVAGHTSDRHPFFKDALGNPASRYATWYHWLDDGHTAYRHFGTARDMPQLNQDNPETAQYLIDVAEHWIDRADVDGYRLDYAKNVSLEFWGKFRDALKAKKPDVLLLGEVWDSGLKIAPYYQELDATFDFPLYFDIHGSHDKSGSSALLGTRQPNLFVTTLEAQERLFPPGAQSVRFLSNHDTVRIASQAQGDLERAKLAGILLLTLPGTPMIYYGEEIGMLGDKSDGDRTVREPMDWYAAESGEGMTTWYRPDSGFNKPGDGISVEEQDGLPSSILETYRMFSRLRVEHPVLRSGAFVPLKVTGSDRVIAFARVSGDTTMIILINLAAQATNITVDFGELDLENVELVDALSSEPLPSRPGAQAMIQIAPLSARVFELGK